MNLTKILDRVRARCIKSREKGFTLAHDIEHHGKDNFLVDVALNLIEGTDPPFDIEAEQWERWMAEDYEERLIKGIALLVQEVERHTETPL